MPSIWSDQRLIVFCLFGGHKAGSEGAINFCEKKPLHCLLFGTWTHRRVHRPKCNQCTSKAELWSNHSRRGRISRIIALYTRAAERPTPLESDMYNRKLLRTWLTTAVPNSNSPCKALTAEIKPDPRFYANSVEYGLQSVGFISETTQFAHSSGKEANGITMHVSQLHNLLQWDFPAHPSTIWSQHTRKINVFVCSRSN